MIINELPMLKSLITWIKQGFIKYYTSSSFTFSSITAHWEWETTSWV